MMIIDNYLQNYYVLLVIVIGTLYTPISTLIRQKPESVNYKQLCTT